MKKGCAIVLGVAGALMVVGLGTCFYAAKSYEKEHPELARASDRLSEVESQLANYKGQTAMGNNDRARDLAQRYGKSMQAIRGVFFTGEASDKSTLSEGRFITYCSLQTNRCMFLLHVPQLRKYTPEAQKAMADMAWRVAVETLRASKVESVEIAVGLRGLWDYSEIMIGVLPPGEDAMPGIRQRTKNNSDLIPFVSDSATPAAEPPKGVSS